MIFPVFLFFSFFQKKVFFFSQERVRERESFLFFLLRDSIHEARAKKILGRARERERERERERDGEKRVSEREKEN